MRIRLPTDATVDDAFQEIALVRRVPVEQIRICQASNATASPSDLLLRLCDSSVAFARPIDFVFEGSVITLPLFGEITIEEIGTRLEPRIRASWSSGDFEIGTTRGTFVDSDMTLEETEDARTSPSFGRWHDRNHNRIRSTRGPSSDSNGCVSGKWPSGDEIARRSGR
jgi:hypothetical protein